MGSDKIAKSEIRNPKSETNPKSEITMFQTALIRGDSAVLCWYSVSGVSNFEINVLNLFRISCFEIRVSNVASDFATHSKKQDPDMIAARGADIGSGNLYGIR